MHISLERRYRCCYMVQINQGHQHPVGSQHGATDKRSDSDVGPVYHSMQHNCTLVVQQSAELAVLQRAILAYDQRTAAVLPTLEAAQPMTYCQACSLSVLAAGMGLQVLLSPELAVLAPVRPLLALYGHQDAARPAKVPAAHTTHDTTHRWHCLRGKRTSVQHASWHALRKEGRADTRMAGLSPTQAPTVMTAGSCTCMHLVKGGQA